MILLAKILYLISIISSFDITRKRDCSSPSGVSKDKFSSGAECCRCTISDNSNSTVSVCGICEGINDAVVIVGCVSYISSVEAGNSDSKLSSLCRRNYVSPEGHLPDREMWFSEPLVD